MLATFNTLEVQNERYRFALPYMGALVSDDRYAESAAQIAYELSDRFSVLRLHTFWNAGGSEEEFFTANVLLSERLHQHTMRHAHYRTTFTINKTWFQKSWKATDRIRRLFEESERSDLWAYRIGITGNPYTTAGGQQFWETMNKIFPARETPAAADVTGVIEGLLARLDKQASPEPTDSWANGVLRKDTVAQNEWRRRTFLNDADLKTYLSTDGPFSRPVPVQQSNRIAPAQHVTNLPTAGEDEPDTTSNARAEESPPALDNIDRGIESPGIQDDPMEDHWRDPSATPEPIVQDLGTWSSSNRLCETKYGGSPQKTLLALPLARGSRASLELDFGRMLTICTSGVRQQHVFRILTDIILAQWEVGL